MGGFRPIFQSAPITTVWLHNNQQQLKPDPHPCIIQTSTCTKFCSLPNTGVYEILNTAGTGLQIFLGSGMNNVTPNSSKLLLVFNKDLLITLVLSTIMPMKEFKAKN